MLGCIIQARTTSSRLPNKVLLKIPDDNKSPTVLEHVIRRVKKSKHINKIIIATTINKSDDELVKYSHKENINCFRGSENNVLERFYLAAKEYNLTDIIRITSDCPFIDWNIIDDLIESYKNSNADYSCNSLVRTFPHGLDVEVFSFDALEESYKNAKEKYEIEHVTPYIYKSNPDKFKINILKAKPELNFPQIRITLDTYQDYTLMLAVYDLISKKDFSTLDICNTFKKHKWLYNINGNINQKKVCKNLDEEVKEALSLLKKQDLTKASNFLETSYYGK